MTPASVSAVLDRLRQITGQPVAQPGFAAILAGHMSRGAASGGTGQVQPAAGSATGAAAHGLSNEERALITREAQRVGVDPALAIAVVLQESGGNPRAVSPAGAMGLMQLMPGTARELGVTDPFDAQQNVAAGVRYLKQKLDEFGGSVPLALAAYNAGSGAVTQWGGVPPYAETRQYVASVMQMDAALSANARASGGSNFIAAGSGADNEAGLSGVGLGSGLGAGTGVPAGPAAGTGMGAPGGFRPVGFAPAMHARVPAAADAFGGWRGTLPPDAGTDLRVPGASGTVPDGASRTAAFSEHRLAAADHASAGGTPAADVRVVPGQAGTAGAATLDARTMFRLAEGDDLQVAVGGSAASRTGTGRSDDAGTGTGSGRLPDGRDTAMPAVAMQAPAGGSQGGADAGSGSGGGPAPAPRDVMPQPGDPGAPRTGPASVHVTLRSDNLGVVNMNLSDRAGEIAGRIVVPSSDVGQNLASRVDTLRAALAERQVQLSDLTIAPASDGRSGRGWGQDPEQQPRSTPRWTHEPEVTQ
ncbi:MAG: transglycosylase SLT domain-containing protein [bacterium]